MGLYLGKYLARIVAGESRFKIGHKYFYVKHPDRRHRLLAEEVYGDALIEAEDLFDNDEMMNFLQKSGIWTDKDNLSVKTAENNIETLKVALVENYHKEHELAVIRTGLQRTKDELERLLTVRHSYDHISKEGYALSSKSRYLLMHSIFCEDGSLYNGWDESDFVTDKLIPKMNEERITESVVREIARNEPWRSIWNSKKSCGGGVFNCPAIDLTEDQLRLLMWSGVYENVEQHEKCPSDEMLADDDAFDGWLILRRREYNKAKGQKAVDDIVKNDKIRSCDEQFIFATDAKMLNTVYDMNSDQSKTIMKERQRAITEKGEVKEAQLPDKSREIGMALTRMHAAKMQHKTKG